ncbi:MAG: peroxiredoxin [Gammaproteobacteria bacterium]|nr:peroxiredoxin [Gammaproteobacteria bacterium]
MSTLVAKKAPDFCAPAVLGSGEIIDQFHFSKTINGKYAVLFFYPLDFTFVCPSELIALNRRLGQFKEREVEVIGVSVDSQFTHHAWRNTPVERGGIGEVGYTLVADVTHNICQLYGVEHHEQGVALRATFIIDKEGFVRSQLVNDLPIGRNVDNALRLVDAVQYYEQNGEVCPAGWQRGESGMQPTKEGVADYLSENSERL